LGARPDTKHIHNMFLYGGRYLIVARKVIRYEIISDVLLRYLVVRTIRCTGTRVAVPRTETTGLGKSEWNWIEWNGMEWVGLDWIGLD